MKSPPDSTDENATLAAVVAPEDLIRGSFVAVLHEVIEYPSFFWCETAASERHELVRMRCVPGTTGTPLKVEAICLPFVFVTSPLGECETIDIRRTQLARLDDHYGRTVWKSLRKSRPRSGRKSKADA